MYTISGIENQKDLENLPLFNKKAAQILIGKSGENLNKKIQRLLEKNYLISLKKGWYVSQFYLNQLENKQTYQEYLANQLRKPSYLSLEYSLAKYGLIPEAINAFTSITIKTTRQYQNKLGTFVYKNIKDDLFCGYEEKDYDNFKVFEATKAKALFDYLYLKKNISDDITTELKSQLRINWDNFSNKDVEEFTDYANKLKSKKMLDIVNFIKNNN